MNITLLENHWYDATFSPSARFGRAEGEEHEGKHVEVEPAPESDGSRGPVIMLGPMLVVAGVVAAVIAARRARARRAERAEELRRIEVDAIGYTNDITE
ncbi:hypothetical protein [Haloglomus salinum]|jgi:hypothetical protein|uniref:hypothetical protein n=1 Tax=Haloglomus salinum TaxID=2962673 RepID=UPI0020C98369|nr:hypothetical protein [Haloglomus salinum]